MNGEFSLDAHFDRDVLGKDIERANKEPTPNEPITAFLRERGIRYVVEAPSGMLLVDVAAAIRKYLYSDAAVEPLFEDFEKSPVPDDLRSFFLIILKGVVIEDLTQNPYEAAYELLAQTPFVSVEPDLPYTQFLGGRGIAPSSVSVTSSDDKAWCLRNMKVDKAWKVQPTGGKQDGRGITIGHPDTGWTCHDDLDQINFDHSRAKDYIGPGSDARDPLDYYFNPGHGTKTGSVIMSRGGVVAGIPPGTKSPGQITGVARYATYVPVRCIKTVVIIFNTDVARAIRYTTAMACDVISLSMGGRPMKALHHAIKDAVRSDLIVVCAAGNEVPLVVWPARYPEALAVAANNCSDKPWDRSSRGRDVDITAPGEAVWVADPDPAGISVKTGDGTSYSAANLAGVAALWLAFHSKKKLLAIAKLLNSSLQEVFRSAVTATARVPMGWDAGKYGGGIVNAEQLLRTKPTSGVSQVASRSTPDEFAALVNDVDPQKGAEVLEKLFQNSMLSWQEMALHFGHELANVFLDNLEILGLLREIEIEKGDDDRLSEARELLVECISITFQKAARW